MFVDTVLNLALTAGSASGEYCHVSGYYASGDGGGGTFYWDQNATEAPNGGTIVGTTGNPGRWKRIISNNPENYKVDVRWFGAKGDGANDDTTLIQKAIAAADVVVFPAGSYLIKSSLNFPAAKEYIFEDAVIKGHFNDFLIKLFSMVGRSFMAN